MSLLDIENVCKYTDELMIDEGAIRIFLETYCLNSIVDKNNIIWESLRTYYLEPSNDPYEHLTRMVDVNTWPIVLEANIISFHPNVHRYCILFMLAFECHKLEFICTKLFF